MDLDKLTLFLKTFGFPAAIAIWFLWKIQGFMDSMAASQITLVELMRQLLEKH